jgi:2-methylisocitrate lyase-like PEP mutase family enzyme
MSQEGAMNRTSQRERAEAFRRLHREGGILVLPNAWDVITARVIESVGVAAIATSSAGVAWALGYADGERISRGEMLAVVRRIAVSVRVPVTADMEAGYGTTPEAAAETARGVIAAGAVGLNLEDGTNDGRLVDSALHQDRIRAMREVARATGIPLVINARTDAFEVKEWSPTERLTAAVRRANAYRAAGADCLFVPHVNDAATIGRLAREIEGPLNVIAGPPAPTIPELERLGVKRASLGPRVVQATLGLVRRAAMELRERGTYETMTDLLIPFTELQRLVAPTP